MSSARRLEWLEVMRGLAAVWVVLHHASLSVSHFIGPLAHDAVPRNGHLGVDFFFVLSGFIIAHSSAQLVARGQGLRAYVRARLVRVYVPYLPVGVAMLLAYSVFPALSGSGREVGVFTTLTLLPSNVPPALSVAWTLVHEVIFYGVFATYFLSRRLHVVALVAWALVVVGCWWREVEASVALTYVVSPRNLSFLVGVLVFHLRRALDARGFTAADAPVALAGVLVIAWQALSASGHVLATVGFAALVFGGGVSLRAGAKRAAVVGLRRRGVVRHLPGARPAGVAVGAGGEAWRSRRVAGAVRGVGDRHRRWVRLLSSGRDAGAAVGARAAAGVAGTTVAL